MLLEKQMYTADGAVGGGRGWGVEGVAAAAAAVAGVRLFDMADSNIPSVIHQYCVNIDNMPHCS